jgi:selenocysteine lyase/cysteine desulfurase
MVEAGIDLQTYFDTFRKHIVGINTTINTPYGTKPLLYADWIASGRLYEPIEQKMLKEFGPYVANTHTETNITGTKMTLAYNNAKAIIKQHVGAYADDVLISYGSGMTGVVNKFQRILGLRIPEPYKAQLNITEDETPVVFVTHMEHHSNHTSWIETICEVVKIEPDENGLPNLKHLAQLLEKYKNRKHKIAAITACSNVTGISTPYYQIAELLHTHGGYCFVDFACNAPYAAINMHPANELQHLDAIFFSPHKFLGGPGTSGILIFNPKLYNNAVPDNPGGGTVKWTNAWNEQEYVDSIEEREDGGTPPFLQTIRIALCIKLKEEMGVDNIIAREHELLHIAFEQLRKINHLHILEHDTTDRLGVISFYIDNCHYNLAVKLLNDKYGIQVRGGCSCAGTYGHYLLGIQDKSISDNITQQIHCGLLDRKPGWVRLSLHPTLTNSELLYICQAIADIANKHQSYATDYAYNIHHNSFSYIGKSHNTVSDEHLWAKDIFNIV